MLLILKKPSARVQMHKKIIICCDGTGNSFENIAEESNVAKLYSALDLDEKQIGYYHPGVGTMGSPQSRGLVQKQWTRMKGLAFGSGLLSNVGDAYRYLMDNYADGDEIYLFGFSRGAFTARALASLIHVFGLLCAGNHELIPYILNIYSKRSRNAKHKKTVFPSDDAFKWQFSHKNEVRIRFCGLWDTVSSYGWVYDPIQLPFLGSNPIIERGRHAISIHERRCFYRDNLWGTPDATQDFRQVWFTGVHSDVGGSYQENTSGLAKIALEWMLVEARKAGVNFDEFKSKAVLGRCSVTPKVSGLPEFAMPDPSTCPHSSLKGWWWLLEVLPQQDPHPRGKRWIVPLGRPRTIPDASRIHESVFLSAHRPSRLPPHTIEPWVTF